MASSCIDRRPEAPRRPPSAGISGRPPRRPHGRQRTAVTVETAHARRRKFLRFSGIRLYSRCHGLFDDPTFQRGVDSTEGSRMVLAIDTLTVARKLEGAGFERRQAEACVEAMRDTVVTGFSDLATQSDLGRFATKEDFGRFATKEDLARALERHATKEDLERFATKEERFTPRKKILSGLPRRKTLGGLPRRKTLRERSRGTPRRKSWRTSRSEWSGCGRSAPYPLPGSSSPCPSLRVEPRGVSTNGSDGPPWA